ncbi:hypothetical protein [Polyangium sp. 6x1]|uniref:hypothetical protein n=1 Tax=Polyangium sp. 6x1 TaxID=3042689 RepID=UPI002482524A|nr:hypothetical protein [Polyangium sp. 6x1]MDI1442910.1 hypothetical protein [Polyangium sp. 6x1]
MKFLHLASTVLLVVSVSSSAARADELSAPASSPKAPDAPKVIIPYTSYTSPRSVEMFWSRCRESLMKAQALEKAGKTQEALDEYDRAVNLQGLTDVEIERTLAQARAGNYLPAARQLQEVLSSQYASGLTVHSREDLTKYLKAIKQYIGTIEIRVNVPGVRITIDGEDVKDWPYFSEFYVEPGMHHIKAMRSGYWLNQTDVEVGRGEKKDLSIAMQERVHSHYVAFPVTPMNVSINANISRVSQDDPPTWPRNLMIGSGVGLGLGLGGLATGVLMAQKSPEQAGTWYGVAVGGGILSALSVSGLVIGLANRPEPPPPNVIITPQFAKDGGGVQFTGAMP